MTSLANELVPATRTRSEPALPVSDIHDLSLTPDSENCFKVFLEEVCDRLGFELAAYAGMNPVDGSTHIYTTYPEAWKKHYMDERLHRFDPTPLMASRSIAPVDWRRVQGHQNYRRLFFDAGDFGIGERGITIPVRGPYGDVGMLSVTQSCSLEDWDTRLRRTIGDLQSAAVHIHDAAMRTGSLAGILRRPMLSDRETEILQWIAAGKSQPDVADILVISTRTVEVHLSSGREKLGALNTTQAAARAVGMGIIHPF